MSLHALNQPKRPTATGTAATGQRRQQPVRRCACGGIVGPEGECAACRAKRMAAERKSRPQQAIPDTPPIVHDVLRSPGQPLDPQTRATLEPRFGHSFGAMRVHAADETIQTSLTVGAPNTPHEQQARAVAEQVTQSTSTTDDREQPSSDFSEVRIHTDSRAAAAARTLHADAFTLGRHIVFGAGQYAPSTTRGQRLLAHELTHVMQQGQTPGGVIQRAITPELDKIESYLSYGIFDWAITDADAIKALELLKQLSRYQQAVFFSNQKYLERLRDNLPKDRLAELNELEANLGAIRPAPATVEDIRDKLSYGLFDWVVTDAEAVAALEKLKQLPPDQLSVALGSINYSRLLDNLPESRKQEMLDLLSKGLAAGGARETEEKTHPGAILNNLTFTSDHGFLKDNKSDWSSGGALYGEPEWFVSEKKTVSHPISQTKDTSVNVDLSLNILPIDAPAAPIVVTGDSDVDYLKFSFSGTMQGGMVQKLSLISTGKLPNAVSAIHNKTIAWKMKWRNWEHEIARTGPHTIFTTMGTPARPDQVTYRRMAKAVEIAENAGTLVPHDLVKNIAFIWGAYNLDVQYANEWDLADNPDLGAQCIDLVRFVQAVIGTIGCPGLAEAVIVWAHPSAPTVGIETAWGFGGGMRSVGPHPLHPDWRATLLDGDDRPNNYEAALKFTDSGMTRYYPGGVRSVLVSPDEVLRVFSCLVWLTWEGGKNCNIQEVLANYQGTCTPGVFQCIP